MVNVDIYTRSMVILAPVASALLCGIAVAFSVPDSRTRQEHRLKITTIFYFLFNACTGIGIFTGQFFPALFARISPLFFLSFLLFNVHFYHMIYLVTPRGTPERFRQFHFTLPLVITLLIYAVRNIMEELNPTADGFMGRFSLQLGYLLCYTALTMRRLYAYQREMAGSAQRAIPTQLVYVIVICSLLTLFSTLISLVDLPSRFSVTLWTVLSAFSLFVMHIEIAYHLAAGTFRVYQLSNEPETNHQYKGTISSQLLEQYFQRKKPYLNADFRIADVVRELDVNRTLVSGFINRTYQVNFTRYVNRWRLDEIAQRQGDPTQTPTEQAVKAAGFTDLKHYRRAKQQEEENETKMMNK
jgi:AraC-like DNA-binding protein